MPERDARRAAQLPPGALEDDREPTPDRAGVDPYRRKIVTFQGRLDRELDAQVVELGRVARDRGLASAIQKIP